MFRKFFIFALFATACGYVFASDLGNGAQQMPQPVWPAAGSEADVQYNYDYENCKNQNDDCQNNARIVSKDGTDLVVENNINMGNFAGRNVGEGWSGGADLTHPYQAPSGFNIFESQAEMPLMHTEMMEDDGGSILAISRSNKSKVKKVTENKIEETKQDEVVSDAQYETDAEYPVSETDKSKTETAAEVFDATGAKIKSSTPAPDQVRSWVVASGQTLREVLQDWCDKEGWDLVWNTSREYPIQASAVFKGRFMDVSSALVRNFSRATPIPYAKFFKGNRVLVITTTEE